MVLSSLRFSFHLCVCPCSLWVLRTKDSTDNKCLRVAFLHNKDLICTIIHRIIITVIELSTITAVLENRTVILYSSASVTITVMFPVSYSKVDYFSSQCQRAGRISTWCQPHWDLRSDSVRRSKSSCRCLQDDRLWWHESTVHTGNACRLWNVCGEQSQICDTANEKRSSQEWIK